MAINVTVSGSGSIIADVSGADSATIAISASEVIDVGVAGGIGPAAYINGTNTTVIGVHPVEAGANITVTTTSGSYTIIGRDVPVQSVQGRIGNVVLTLNDLTAAALSHTHSTAQVVGFTAAASAAAPVQAVQGRTGNVVLSLVDLTAAAASHTHSTTEVVGFTAAASAAAPVQTVQGRAGNVVLTLVDLTAAAASHTHSTTEVIGLTAAASAAAPVQSVQGRTGNVVLTLVDLTAAAASHTHSTTQVVGFTAAASEAAPVQSVAGRTGHVVLSTTDLQSFTYVRSVNSITGSVSVVAGANVTVTSGTDSIEITGPVGLPDQSGASGRLLGSNGQDAGWYSLVAGSNVTIVRNTNSRFIQVSASGGGGTGGGGGTALWPALIFGG